MLPFLIMFNPDYCKEHIDTCFDNLFKASRGELKGGSEQFLLWYWASALIEWANQLQKVEKYIRENPEKL